MSRVGKNPIPFEKDVQVSMDGDVVKVKGKKYEQLVRVRPEVAVKIEDNNIVVTRKDDEPQSRAYHGLYRALLQNAVTGVTTGFSRQLELNGVGYRAAVKGKVLELNLGYSHPIQFEIPQDIEIKVEKLTKLAVSGPSREQVGQVAAKIRDFRPPEPFLGKGVKYADEMIRRKAGKSAGK